MNARRLILASLALACATAGLALSCVPAQAEVTHKYLSQLTGFEYPAAIAFDASGDVYVADAFARTVDRFSPAGTPLAFSASEPYIKKSKLTGIPTGPGGSLVLRFGRPSGVAVNDENGDVYVSDPDQHVVDVFSSTGEYLSQLTGTPPAAPVSGPFKDPQGLTVDQSTHDLYVADPESDVVDVFSSTGAYVSQFGAGILSGSFGESIAVNDLTEDLYVGDRGTGTVDVFDSMGGSLISEWSGASTPGGSFANALVHVGLDPRTDHVYVADTNFAAGFAAVEEFGSSTSEEYVGQLTGTPSGRFGELEAVGVDPVNGDLYVGNERTVVDVFGPDVTVPDVTVQAASGVGKNTVALSGSVDPVGIQVSSCEFEYGPSTSYAYGQSVPCKQTPAQIGAGNSPVTVTAKPVDLLAGTEYHFRLKAANAGGSNTSSDETFTTPPAVDALSTGPAEDVTPNTAKLTGSLSPDGADTHYYFQYGTEETFGSTSPALPGSDAGSASGSVSATTGLTGLAASTTYQYRLVGVNSFGATYGQEKSFTTSPAVEGLSTGPAQDVAAGGAKLTGSLSPDGTDAHYYFEYGSTASYGSISPALPGTDAGTAGVVSAETSLSGLEGGTHHYRLVAVNSFGTTYGADRTFFLPGPAANGHFFSGSFGAEGPGTSSFGGSDIQSIAVDESTGDVYVYSGYPGYLYKFNSSGEPVDFSSTGTNIMSVGGFGGGEDEVAVDNSSGPDKGDLYVADGGEFGAGVTVYESDGSEVGELNGGVESLGAPWGAACGVAVDPEGDVYVAFGDGENAKHELVNHVNKYTPAGPAGTPLSNSDYTSTLTHTGLNKSCNIAVDSKGDVYLDTHPQGPVVEYPASQFGELQAVGTTFDERGNTIAVEPGGGHEVYIDEGSDVAQYGGTGGLLGKFAGSGLGAVKNSVGVAVNASTHEVYVADEEGAGEAKVNIFSAVPTGPPTVQASVADVASTSATLQAQIDPNGRDTHYYFQYGTADCTTSPSSCADVPAAPGQDIGSGEFDQTVSIHPQDLLPDTVYHFRVVAVNALNETTDGTDQTFTTQPGGSELVLPDGRAWELVSPANKNGSLIEPFGEGGVDRGLRGRLGDHLYGERAGRRQPSDQQQRVAASLHAGLRWLVHAGHLLATQYVGWGDHRGWTGIPLLLRRPLAGSPRPAWRNTAVPANDGTDLLPPPRRDRRIPAPGHGRERTGRHGIRRQDWRDRRDA
jgi:DNA-binding beta-propeller fold protein YncE